MNVIRVNNLDGTFTEYEVRDPSTVTLVEWVNLVVPPLEAASTILEDLERTYTLVQRFASIPRDVLRKLPFTTLQTLVQAMSDTVVNVDAAQKDEGPLPDKIDHGGVTYVIPKDPGTSLTTGQYIDIVARLEKVEYEAESIAAVLAVMLQPEGKEYDSSTLEDQMLTMGKLPAMTAVKIAAFFFAGCEPLNEAWSRSMSRRLTSKLHGLQRDLASMLPGGDGTPSLPDAPATTGSLHPSTGHDPLS